MQQVREAWPHQPFPAQIKMLNCGQISTKVTKLKMRSESDLPSIHPQLKDSISIIFVKSCQ